MQPAVFLDRDNTLIANDGDLGDPNQVRLMDGVAGALKRLHDAGYRLIVVTNQGGVARGKYTEEDVDAVHQRIAALIDEAAETDGMLDRFYYCPYHPQASVEEYRRDHPWRKPHPGMLLQAARDLHIDLAQSWLIGDQPRDIQAGRAAGCRAILLTNDQSRHEQAEEATEVVGTLDKAVEVILNAAPARASTAARGSNLADNVAPTPMPASHSPRDVPDDTLRQMRQSMQELAEEIRLERMQRGDFTPLMMVAVLFQLLALLLALLGMLQLEQSTAFMNWMIGAGLVQLLVITTLLFDARR
ncbi:MAG: HAD family hydrolase [Phycisphaerales bacterium]|nr:MAG: HAD family hydrolase [Phycisphaerales bacterium]